MIQPTPEECQALFNLYQQGVDSLSIYFSGSNDYGTYDEVRFHPARANVELEDLKTASIYMESILDNTREINFNDDGCRGEIAIKLGDEIEVHFFVESPVWETVLGLREPLELPIELNEHERLIYARNAARNAHNVS